MMARDLITDDFERIVVKGASKQQLARMFEMPVAEVGRRLTNLEPVGMRNGYQLYRVKQAAPLLTDNDVLGEEIEALIKRMGPKDLPLPLQKEYWAAQHAKLKYEEDRGDLWRSVKIIELLGEVFKTFSITIRLTQDRLEKETRMSPEQRRIAIEVTDGALVDVRNALVERFENGNDDVTPGSGLDTPSADENGDARSAAQSEDEEL